MFTRDKNLTVAIWLGLSIIHLLILLLIIYLPILQDSSFTAFGITAVIVPYLLHFLGLPVLIDDGLSGWALASPNIWGWSLSILFWLFVYYLIAKFIVYLLAGSKSEY